MRRWTRNLVLPAAFTGAAIAGTMLAISVNVATGGTSRLLPMHERDAWWLSGGTTAAVAFFAWLLWFAERRYEHGLRELIPAVQRPEPWVVDRPAELRAIVRALRHRGGGTVGITTAIQGAGGFGKTTIASLVRADRRVLRFFRGRVYWVTLGRDSRRGVLVEKVNDLVRRLDPDRAQPFTDVRQAAEHLAAVLSAGPRRLVILDDVWFDDQLAAFPVAGRCARLVTTRMNSLVGATSVPVAVDQMSDGQARRVITANLRPAPDSETMEGLIAECGRWPLLLRLVNRILVDRSRAQTNIASVAKELLHQLRHGSALQLDEWLGTNTAVLDVNDPDQRDQAVITTVEASTGLLNGSDRSRFAELATFVRGEAIPMDLVVQLWKATGGLDMARTIALCNRLARLALLTLKAGEEGGTIDIHDVMHDYLMQQLGRANLKQMNEILVGSIAATLPRIDRAAASQRQSIAWWFLPEQARYVRDHLVEHLLDAGREAEADAMVCDLRWAQSRIDDAGPLAAFSDLARIDTARTARLRQVLSQAAHLLTPTEPPHSLVDVLYTRVWHDPEWGEQAQRLAEERTMPAMVVAWPLPDQPSPALRRSLSGHRGTVLAVAIAPECDWLASGAEDGVVRIWDAATGIQRGELKGHLGAVPVVEIAPDGTFIITAGEDGTVRMWDPITGRQRAELTGGVLRVLIRLHFRTLAARYFQRTTRDRFRAPAFALASDGSWIATASGRSVRIWDTAIGRQRARTGRHNGNVINLVTPADGSWFATTDEDTVFIWDAGTGKKREKVGGRLVEIRVNRVAPDGTWLATVDVYGRVLIWRPITLTPVRVLVGHDIWMQDVGISPDSSLLAAGNAYGWVQVWDAKRWKPRVEIDAHPDRIAAIKFAPDGSWFATAGASEGPVRLWESITGKRIVELPHPGRTVQSIALAHNGNWLATAAGKSVSIWDVSPDPHNEASNPYQNAVTSIAFHRDGTWLAAGGSTVVEIWDSGTGSRRASVKDSVGFDSVVAIAPDGTWMATASGRSVSIWDTATNSRQANLKGFEDVVQSVAIAPDGTWMATASGRSVSIWDTATNSRQANLKGFEDVVQSVAISLDSRWLATAGGRSLHIWNAKDHSCCAMMRVDNTLRTCGWDPLELSLVAGGSAGLYKFQLRRLD